LKLSGEPRFDGLLAAVATCVLEQAGYDPIAVDDILARLRTALQEGADQGQRDCDVQFRAEAGQLVIVLTYVGGRAWRVERALPD
jgi:hypothetical protein